MLAKNQMLEKSPLCEGLDEQTVKSLMGLVEFRAYEPNDRIVFEGEDACHIFYVATGIVRLTRAGSSGREADIAICEAGDLFADYLLSGGHSYALGAWATDFVEVGAIDLFQLRVLAEQHPGIERNMMRIASRHLLEAFDCIAGDRSQTAPQRVANYFLRHCPASAAQATFRLPYRKRILAGKLGLAPEALSRAFSTLAGAGVRVSGSIVRIESVERLRAAC
jgi:CRP-like cAMP-binding protein